MKAALKSLKGRQIPVISAVKPPHKHNEISHFFSENGETKLFEKKSNSLRVLLKLRDEAHALANYVHRTKREMAHFYEVSRLTPDLKEKERQSLLQKFGSLTQLKKAPETEIVEFLGEEKGKSIY